jgi:hypothetical protein
MLGYTLYLSGLVFLNQLQVEVNPGYRSDHISNLKIVFTVLGAMRQFYTPAYVWTETLLHVHSAEPISEAVALAHSPSSLFTSFMARFPDIKEPPFCPMNQSDIRAIRHQMEQTVTAGVVDENDDRNRTQITKVRSGAMGLDVQHEVSIDDDDDDDDPEYAGQSSVLDGYSRALEDAIENMVDPTEDSIFSPQMVSQQQPRQESAIAQVTRAIVSHSRVNGHTNELNPSRDIHETLDQNISEMDFSIPSFELPNSTLTAAEAMMSLFLEPQNIDMDLSLDLECAEDIDHGGAFLDRELWLPQLQ